MKTVVRLLFSMVVTAVAVEPTFACWCVRKTLYTDADYRLAVGLEFRNRDAVFSGEVTDKTLTHFTLRVLRVWKGAISPTVRLSSEYLEKKGSEIFLTNCAYSQFKIGKIYLVSADSLDNQLQVSECSRTQLWNAADKDTIMLNELKTHATPATFPQESRRSRFFLGRNPTTRWIGAAGAWFL